MGRPLAGPIRIGSSLVWYARLTVKPSDRPRAGCNRLTRSLGTTNHGVAMKRWGAAYKALEKELAERLSLPVTEHHLIRARIDSGMFSEVITPQGLERLDPHESAELILNQEIDETNPLHRKVLESITGSTTLLTWEDVVIKHLQVRERKTGRSLAPSTEGTLYKTIDLVKPYCDNPQQFSREHALKFIKSLEGFTASTITNKCAYISAIINTSIRSGDLAITNPFLTIDYRGVTQESEKRKDFIMDQVKELINGEYGNIFRLMIGTGLRVGEVFSRNLSHIDENMLIVNDVPEINFRVKTRSSIRRVPLDDLAVSTVKEIIQENMGRHSWALRLRNRLREVTQDKRLVLHSCRHTYKTLTRKVGIPIEISDEISGHAKRNTSSVSDGYGSYPDERLLKENSKVWSLLL